MLLFLLFSLASLVALQEFSIYTLNTVTSQESELGLLSYDPGQNSALFRPHLDLPSAKGSYSVCARDLACSAPCFAYQEIGENTPQGLGGKFKVAVGDDGSVTYISFERGEDPAHFACLVARVETAPTPNLNPFHRQAAQQNRKVQTQKVVRKKVVENDNGEKVEVDEETDEVVDVDSRSWVQKNWMYIVPPLVLFLIFSPAENKDGGA
ncbi:hypothetical protein METBIDRAFT_11843 [Metschnikowia bicuspidata var. bicuspidata NRRL YB-4993]|uniref:ER membrane protein complex subunit 10 n=1 Tax=Metschnikowia bicuspidata var. bicuspidata NRRL YB-4993 TaxID=869754 RepID=A0A1A0HBE0_9ASCO|nr:hypothetical protein METBIDRAFT_11843 [Metschnikowia bicuspidata var. bicuspidata NRRL YB-4993]OBA21305.1 hypothetical protein METBIDRAFT_11843 [Metschnikowia bicuspidata var. bicuspidata NRRL YB-4993]